MDKSSVHRIEPDEQGRVYNQPDPAAPESKRDAKWYVDNIKYCCSFYDQWYTTVTTGNFGTSANLSTQGSNTSAPSGMQFGVPFETPVRQMIRMMSYYNGYQPNLDYNHLTKNVTTTNLMPSWIRSQKIYSIINVMKDVVSQMISNIDFDMENLNDDAQSEKKAMLDKLMIQYELRDQLQALAAQGATIDSSGGRNFEMAEDIKYWMEEGYKDQEADNLIRIARHLWLTYGLEEKYLQAFIHAITAGRCGIEHTVVNGKQKFNLWMPYELIVDVRKDDEFNRRAQFVGTIKYLTPNEIFTMWPDMLIHKDEIEEMAKESSMTAPYNTMTNMSWWYYGGAQQRGVAACVTAYWKTLRPEQRITEINEFGKAKLRKVNGDEAGDRMIEDVCQGTLIGNRFLTQAGYANNVVEDFYDKSKVRLPIQVYLPNMLDGVARSVTSRMSALSDEYDAIRFKMREMIGRAKGKTYFVKGWKFGNNANQKEIDHDLTTLGFHVLTHSGEQETWHDDEGNVIEPLDMTLDPNVLRLQDILNMINQEMLEVAKVSLTSLGNDNVQKYMGTGVMQNAVQGGSGNSTLYSNYINFIQHNMQYATDIAKYLYTEDESDFAQNIIGKRGVEYLKLSKKLRYSNPLAILKVAPFITNEQRMRLLAIADRLSQQGGIDLPDYIDVELATTMPDLKRTLKYSTAKKKAENEHEQAMMAQLDQLAQQNRDLAAQMQALIREQGMNQRHQQTIQADQRSQNMQIASDHLMNAQQIANQPQPQAQ